MFTKTIETMINDATAGIAELEKHMEHAVATLGTDVKYLGSKLFHVPDPAVPDASSFKLVSEWGQALVPDPEPMTAGVAAVNAVGSAGAMNPGKPNPNPTSGIPPAGASSEQQDDAPKPDPIAEAKEVEASKAEDDGYNPA